MAENINIGGRLHSTATGNVVAGANEILDDTKGKKQSVVNQETDAALADRYTKEETYSKQELNGMVSPQHDYVVVETYADLEDITDHSNGCVYRVSNYDGTNSQVDATMYSEYAWDGTQYVHLATKSQIGEVFDVSEYNATGGTLATYASLNALLSDANLGTIIPVGVRKGGMSIKFVLSVDSKYVQFRYMGTEVTGNPNPFLDTANWQGVDEKPTVGSQNLVKSGGVFDDIYISGTPYLLEESTFNGDMDAKTFKNFIIDFKLKITRDNSKNYGVYWINNGLPAGTSYSYYFRVYSYPASETPTSSNLTGVGVFQSATKPENGVIETPEFIALLNWDALTEAFGGTNYFNGTGNGLRFNQEYLFDSTTGCLAENKRFSDIESGISDIESGIEGINEEITALDEKIDGIDEQIDGINDTLTQTTQLTIKEYLDKYYLNKNSHKITGPSESYDTSLAVYDVENLVGTVNISADTIDNNYFLLWGLLSSAVSDAEALAYGNVVTQSKTATIQFDGTQAKYLVVACKKSNHITSVTVTSDLIPSIEADIENLNNELTEIEQRLQGKVEVILPDNLQAVVGDTLQLFFRGMVLAVNPYNYDIVVKCNKGAQYERYFEYTPVVADIGTTNLEIEVLDNEGNLIAEKSCTLTTVAEPQSPLSNKNILCFGDSLTSHGEWPAEAARRLIGNGGTPSGKNLSNIVFCGSLTKDLAHYFGAGGWSWNSYTHKGSDAYRFTVSGVTSVNFRNVYSNNGYEFTVQEVNITNGSGTILCSVAAGGTPTASGVLTRVSGGGDAEISFSNAVFDVQNPLWDESNNKVSFIPYAQEYCNNQIDAVYVLLSWNGLSPFTKSFNSVIADIKIFADTLHSEYPNAKLKIMGIQAPNQKDLHGYGAEGGYSNKYGMTYTAMMLNKTYQDFANSEETSGTSGDTYNTFVEFIDIASQFDSEYNMQMGAKKVNTRNTTTETIGTNGVHPAESGYMQIADSVYRNIVANYCQST